VKDVVETPHGRCVSLAIDEEPPLMAEESALAAALGPVRRRELAAGRAAMRAALGQDDAIRPNARGAPILPAGWVGSISHKGARAAAIVAPAADGFIGVDLELAAASPLPIERRILTRGERATGREVTLHFAIKEAIYKAIDPIVRRYVGFTEVALELAPGGGCVVHVLDVMQLPVVVEAWWQERDGHWLATARAKRVRHN
jgi:4'-phosphopantetheinyl transferase EntD